MAILPQPETLVLNRVPGSLRTDATLDRVVINSIDSDATTTAVNAPDILLVGSYYSSGAIDRVLRIRHTVTDTPNSTLSFAMGAYGSETTVWSYDQTAGFAIASGDLTVTTGDLVVTAGDINVSAGNVNVDGTLVLSPTADTGYGRITTGSTAGAAIDINENVTWSEGAELRYTISNWTGKPTRDSNETFVAGYFRSQSDVDSTTAQCIGVEGYAVANATGLGNLYGGLFWAYPKGDSTDTVGAAYGVRGEFSMDASRVGTLTITTEAAGVLSRITSGVVDDYTKIHLFVGRPGDMDGGSRKYGSGLRLLDGVESGTSSLSNVIYTDMAADYFYVVSAADMGAVDDTIAGQTVGTINALVKCKFASTDFYLYGYNAGPSA